MCPEYYQLASIIDSILSGLTELTRAHLLISRTNDDEASKCLAIEIKRDMAELEGANLALRQHVAEHNCHGTDLP